MFLMGIIGGNLRKQGLTINCPCDNMKKIAWTINSAGRVHP